MDLMGSPRARRRVAWIGGCLAAVGVIAGAIALLPKGTKQVDHLRPGAQVVTVPDTVRMNAERRHMINDLLDVFVPAAVERRDPMRALPFVTHSFRSATSRDEWARGDLPVFPYHAKGNRFHNWTVNYSFAHEISVDVLMHPSAKETLGPQAYTAVFKQSGKRWLIDSFVTSASFARDDQGGKVVAAPDFTPFAETKGKAQLSKKWLLVPAFVFALMLLTPIVFGISRLRRSRRAWREYRASQASLD
jgi:hypothetical protein